MLLYEEEHVFGAPHGVTLYGMAGILKELTELSELEQQKRRLE